jgi:hypothetical protein
MARSDYCYFHDPDKADARREAQAAGGRQNRARAPGPDAPVIEVADCRDVVRLLARTINEVRRGEVDPRVANTVGYLSSVAVRAMEQGDLEERVAQIESALRNPRPTAMSDEHGEIPA